MARAGSDLPVSPVDEPFAIAPARLPWSVAALLSATGDALQARFGTVAVRGELASFTRAASGHCYFTLKDSDGAAAALRCVLFRRAAQALDFAPAEGVQVQVRGRLGLYEARGELQLVADSLQRLGTGNLYEEFLRRRARLQAEGLFNPERKRPLPPYPRTLAVVTSRAAAALQDVLTALARRAPQVRVVVVPAAVQGVEAPEQLVQALGIVSRREDVDAVLLVRGGGSLEDLWAFNDERVVRAVAACAWPVVCGVGHETDITLCDLAADLRAPTPTAAAELAAPPQADLLLQLRRLQQQAQRAVQRRLEAQAQRLDHLTLRLGQPGKALAGQQLALQAQGQRLERALAWARQAQQQRLAQNAQRLQRAVAVALQGQRQRLQGMAQALQAQDPARVLRRGYAWVTAEDGQPLTRAQGLQPGQRMTAVWADGRALARVERVDPSPAAGLPPDGPVTGR